MSTVDDDEDPPDKGDEGDEGDEDPPGWQDDDPPGWPDDDDEPPGWTDDDEPDDTPPKTCEPESNKMQSLPGTIFKDQFYNYSSKTLEQRKLTSSR